jgi:hypothetical protein
MILVYYGVAPGDGGRFLVCGCSFHFWDFRDYASVVE